MDTMLGMPPQVSLAVTVKNTAVGTLEVSTMFDGQKMDNWQLELTTVTVKLQTLVWSQASVAVTFTVVVPTGNVLPLGGLAEMDSLPQPPLALTEKNSGAPLELVATAKRLLEQLRMRGGVAAWRAADPSSSRFATTNSKALFVFMAQRALTMIGFIFAAP